MEKYGQIKAILNLRQLLIQIDKEFADRVVPGEELIVFAKLDGEPFASLGLSTIRSPKGKIRVVMRQDDQFFLAERFKEGGRTEEKPVFRSLEGLFTQPVVVGATWSAEIDEEKTLKIRFENAIEVGDEVGRL